MYEQLAFFGMPSLKVLRERPGDCVSSEASQPNLLDLVSAVLGNPDTALLVLARFATPAELARVSVAELCQIKGVGKKGAARIKAGIELGRRSLHADTLDRPQIKSPGEAANLLIPSMGILDQEEMRVILLDVRMRLIEIATVYKGSLNTTAVRVGELFKAAVRVNASAIIIAHNHPSSDPSPSPEDVAVTQQIVSAGKLLDVDVLDHIVVGGCSFTSLREKGLGFS
ncbi:MAG: DNA repair protein RadC [Thermoflexales bacterium]|nr:DNA repair protein RadC [Thermoflexales bacterium]